MRAVNLKGLFTREAIAYYMGTLPELKTTIMDLAFKARPARALPTIGIADLTQTTGTIPLIKRGGTPIAIGNDSAKAQIVAPLPLMPSDDITAAELNDLQMIFGDSVSREQWVAKNIDKLRRTVRDTTEAIATIVLTTGKYSWPVQVGASVETFEIYYGDISTVTPKQMSDAPNLTLTDVYNLLDDMNTKVQENGGSGTDIFLAGKTAFGHILQLAQGWSSAVTQPINVQLGKGYIDIGGYVINRVAEKYKDPISGNFIDKIDAKEIIGFADDPQAGVTYCAIDSISQNNAPSQFGIYVKELDDVAVRLIAQAKPVPVRNPKFTAKAKVVS